MVEMMLIIVRVATAGALLLKMMLDLRPVLREIDDEMWRR